MVLQLGLFPHKGFQVFGILLELPLHHDFVLHPLQCNFQGIDIDRFGDEIGGLELEAFDRQVHIPVTGDHDYLGFRVLALDLLKQSESVHPRHLDVGHNDRRIDFPENFKRLLAVFGGVDRVSHVGNRHAEHITNIFFVIHQQNRPGIWCVVHRVPSFLSDTHSVSAGCMGPPVYR